MADKIEKLTHAAEELDAAVDMLLDVYTRDEIDGLLAAKVSAEDGMGLSENSFTDAYKDKLGNLENYDDTDVKAEIAEVSSQAAINKSTLGYQSKNLLINNCKTKTMNGVTATVNEDGSITLSGSSTSANDFIIFYNMATGLSNQFENNKKFLPDGSYIVSGGITNCYVQVTVSSDNAAVSNIAVTSGNAVAFTIGDNNKYVWFRLLIKANADFSTPVTAYPMIRYAEITDNTYEPYKPSVEERLAALEEKLAAFLEVGGET